MALIALAEAAPNIAFVRVNDIYHQLDATKKLNVEIMAKREAIMRNERLDAYRAAFNELETIRTDLIKAAKAPQQVRDRIEMTYNLKRQEALTLKREFDEFQLRKNKAISTEHVQRMEDILEGIRKKAADVGQKQGYEMVIDISGKTNTQLPFVLYSKKSEDITSEVLAAMGQVIAGTPSDDDN